MPDPYILGNETLKNKLGLTNGDALAAAEGEIVAAREAQLRGSSFQAPRSLRALRDIHRHLFQDVFDWAGDFRITDLRKREEFAKGKASTFTPHALLTERASEIDADLVRSDYLRGLTREGFAEAAANLLISINRMHPFREGNGRAQRLFMERLALGAGHRLDFTVVTRERMVAVSIAGHNGDGNAVVRLLDEISDPVRIAALAKALTFLRGTKVAWNDLYIATTVTGQVYEGQLVARDAGDTGDFLLRADEPEPRLLIGVSGDLADDTVAGEELEMTASRFGPS